MKEKITKNLIPISVVIAGLVIAGAFVYTNQPYSGEISAEMAGSKTIDFINKNLLAPGMTASLLDISDKGSAYKIRLKIEEMEFDSYISKDGKLFFPEGFSLEEPLDFGAEQPEQPVGLVLEGEELKNFVGCLEEQGFVIYGEEWCSYCQQLVDLLGGKEIVEPIYVDCQEEAELCYAEKEIKGVPAIFINDQEYVGARSFEAFAQETGCPL